MISRGIPVYYGRTTIRVGTENVFLGAGAQGRAVWAGPHTDGLEPQEIELGLKAGACVGVQMQAGVPGLIVLTLARSHGSRKE